MLAEINEYTSKLVGVVLQQKEIKHTIGRGDMIQLITKEAWRNRKIRSVSTVYSKAFALRRRNMKKLTGFRL